jgi:hypothetical protein
VQPTVVDNVRTVVAGGRTGRSAGETTSPVSAVAAWEMDVVVGRMSQNLQMATNWYGDSMKPIIYWLGVRGVS